MFELQDKVRYTLDYIRNYCDTGIDKLCAAQWRGRIVEDYGTNVYLVVNCDYSDEITEISGDILEFVEE